jgi:glycosyltransferase involved in cell wall biosynthesis
MRHEVKRQEDFIAALALMRVRRPDVQGWIVGEGGRQAQLEALAGQLGLAGTVHFLGRRRDVPAVLRRATLGVLCSQQEGLSNAVIEGMAAGLPMVVTDAGGNRELVAHEKRGLVVPVRNPQALSEAMFRVLDDPMRARQMGLAGRAFVARELTLDRMIREHEVLYRNLATADGPAVQVSTADVRSAVSGI